MRWLYFSKYFQKQLVPQKNKIDGSSDSKLTGKGVSTIWKIGGRLSSIQLYIMQNGTVPVLQILVMTALQAIGTVHITKYQKNHPKMYSPMPLGEFHLQLTFDGTSRGQMPDGGQHPPEGQAFPLWHAQLRQRFAQQRQPQGFLTPGTRPLE